MKTFVPLEDVESVLPILSEIAIFGGFSDRQLSEIFKYLEESIFKQGEYIFRQGDEPSYIYIVKKGNIDLLITKQKVILKKKTLAVGDCFGEASLMAMHKHTATAVAGRTAKSWSSPDGRSCSSKGRQQIVLFTDDEYRPRTRAETGAYG